MEKIQKFSDAPLTVCPHCGGALEKLLHAPAVSFKGGGWYADGYGNAKPKSSGDTSAKPTESPSKPASDSKSSGDNSSSSNAAASSAPAATTSSASADKK